MVIIQFRYLYLLSLIQNVTTSLRRRYPTSLWSCHIVAMETSDEVAKTTYDVSIWETSLWRLYMRRWNDVVFATSPDVSIATIWRYIRYELKSLTHELETWYKNYLWLFVYILKIVSIKKNKIKKSRFKRRLSVPVSWKKIWTVKANWLMLYDWLDIVGRNYCVVRIFFLGCVS